MLVVHGAWSGGRLALWAEDTSSPPRPVSRARSRPHPFAADPGTLARALGDFSHHAEEGELSLLLPGSAVKGPLPSPESGLQTAIRRPRLAVWRVPALLFRPADALRFLGSAADFDIVSDGGGLPDDLTGGPSPEWGPGASLRYFSVVAETARHLVRRGRVLPALFVEDGRRVARWRPVLAGRDAAAFRDLAAAMPPLCRAVRLADGRADPPAAGDDTARGRPSAEGLHEALTGLTDAAVRLALPERLLAGPRPGPKSPLPDRWLLALTGDDATVPGIDSPAAEAEAAELAAALDGWHAAAREAEGPFRVAFRLIEPVDDEAWKIEFALQSAEDPGFHVPAARLWEGERIPGLPARAGEVLLAGLGRAVRLCPELYHALRADRPTSMAVDTAWAFGFLRRSAPLLSAAGYGVLLPAWAGRKPLGLKLTARTRRDPGAAAGRGLSLNEIVDFRFDLAVGEHTLSEEELAELARAKVPLVRVRGQWVELDEQRLKAALTVLERHGSGEMTVGDVINQVVEGGDDGLPLLDVDADGLLGDLLSGEADRRLTPVPTPAAFNGTLRPYQERGLSWLDFLSSLGLGGILADDMGLGKTAQTLSLLLNERNGRHVGPTLLVCPMSVVSNWQREAARFAPSLRVYVHHGGARRRGAELAEAVAAADLVITTYGTVLRDLDALRALTWERVVCDEAQAIKNSVTRQSQAVRAIPARTRLALTGTPVENHLAELWSIMEFCNPGLLGPARRFRERFQEPIEARGDEQAARALKRATGPFVLRRLKTDKTIISDLPEKLEMKVWCTLTPEQASLYQAVVNDTFTRIEGSKGIERRANVLATMTRLKQVCNHPAHLLKDGSRLAGRSGKLARLEELAEEILQEGDKALVFTQYTEFGELLAPYLSARLGRPVLWLHGGLPKKRRDELVERFQTDPEPMLFLLSLKAAGTGLNLTAATHVIHVDRWWNPAVEDQATDRAFRIGQRRNVQVRKFICVGTLEERIDEMIERKKALAESVVGTGEDWISSLSTEQLRELFRLGPEAVS
ncbi:DEAD/DEAH box helicase [Thermostaphylospora chromogena]|uniref:Superfamily II DNA or RNA helicase, SNF2 family n=1 Tax=Thermostaphylospora chromogena TaxID=35622 RepID=A0A1H0ZWX8_9ACTN|nr:DEAD/DEAH box helicase [Thermostaphylospora chromogena]SDQ31893.1 Superfamily II DNA or RNA helicase, SNF2 family [Thermostaphylospora chromogena]